MEGKIKIGPAGDKNYKSPTMVNWDEGSHNGIISQIFLSHGSGGIYSIQFQFMLDDKSVLSDPHGQHTGSMFDVIVLNCPHEYITGISGGYYRISGNPYIRTLKFATNTNVYGPFGNSSSNENFIFKLGNFSQFGGFYGTHDATGLQNIGLYLQPTIVKPITGTSNAEETESKIVLC